MVFSRFGSGRQSRQLQASRALRRAAEDDEADLPAPGVGGRGRSPLIRPGAPWPWHCRRRFSPLRRREGPHPLPPTHPVRPKSPAFYGVLCSSQFFPIFRVLWFKMGQLGPTKASGWANIGLKMGQHSPKMGQHSPKMGQHRCKMGQHSPQDGPT